MTVTRAPICTHHWRINPPGGPTSKGKCLKCGLKREFSNVGIVTWWETEAVKVAEAQ